MRKLKRTYKNWLDGNICPTPTKGKISPKINAGNYGFPWTEFSKKDLSDIRTKQKEIFEAEVNKLLTKFARIFKTFYKKAEEKNQLLLNEINKWQEILFELYPTPFQYVTAQKSDITFESNRLIDIRRYITTVYLQGSVPDFSFIHSGKCKFHDHKKHDASIEAEVYYRFWKMLNKMYEEAAANNNHLPFNPNPEIFTDYTSARIFDELKLFTVETKTKAADYSFIFNSMMEHGLIVKQARHKDFINFVNKNHKAGLHINKLPLKRAKYKEKILKAILIKYNITSEEGE